MIRRLYRQVKAFHYRRQLQDLEGAIDAIESALLPEAQSFWHGGPLNGWPRVSVEEHLHELQRRKSAREQWLARYQATTESKEISGDSGWCGECGMWYGSMCWAGIRFAVYAGI